MAEFLAMNLDIPLLKSYVAVVECGSFTRAAERLNLTQSAISLHVRRLEQETGHRLLERNSRAVALTAEGELLLSYAHRILALHDEARSRMGQPLLSGAIRFGVPDYIATHRVPKLLAQFHRAHPQVMLEVSTGRSLDLRRMYKAGDLDLAIAARPVGTADGELLWREPRVWATASFLELDRDAVIPLALFPGGCLSRKAGLEALDRSDRTWRIVYTGHSGAGLKAAALAGLGVTILPGTEIEAGLKTLGPDAGFPTLPDFEFAAFGDIAHGAPAVQRLGSLLIDSLRRAAGAAVTPLPAGASPPPIPRP